MKKIKILLLIVLFGGAVWILSGGISASSEKTVPKALWNAIGRDEAKDSVDTDKDGLADKEEENLGTDPKKADTDGDSFLDGQEVKNGYDPLRKAPGDRKLANTNTNANANSNTNINSNNNTNANTNSQVQNNSLGNSVGEGLKPAPTEENDVKNNVTEQVALKVDDLIARYNLHTTPYESLDEATKSELEKEMNGFSTDIIKSSGLDFAFNIPGETLRLNDNEEKDKNLYLGRAKDILRKHNLGQDSQTIEEGIKSILSDLANMAKSDIDWDKVSNWKRETPTAYQELLELPVNSQFQAPHIRLLRVVKSLDVVFGNINEGDYFRAFLAAGRAEKINAELDKFTEEIK